LVNLAHNKVFDRSGWEELKEEINNSSINSTSSTTSSTARNQININNIQEIIDANSVEIEDEPPVTIPRIPAPDFPQFDEYINYYITDNDDNS